MPTTAEVRAYALGLRLQQALTLANPVHEIPIIHRGFLRLHDAVTALPVENFPSHLSDRLRSLIRRAIRRLEKIGRAIHGDGYDAVCRNCRDDLAMAHSVIAQWTANLSDQNGSLRNWYELGKEIACGEGGGGTPPIPNPPHRRAWAWDRPAVVRDHLRSIGDVESLFFPARISDAAWLDDLPPHLLEWSRLEVGLELLCSTPPSNERPKPTIETVDPRLSPNQRRIVEVIANGGVRLTTEKVLECLSKIYPRVSNGMTKQNLSALVKMKVLDKDPDAKPPGYGLPSWNLPR